MSQIKGPTLIVAATGAVRLHTLASWWRRFTVDHALTALVGAVALGFDLHGLGTASLSVDEAWSVGLASHNLRILWQYIWGQDAHMALYYLLLHGWLHILAFLGIPPVEFMVRLPSAICAALSSVMVFLLGQRFWRRTAGLVASLLYLLNILQLFHAQNARSYSLEALCVCASWYALFAALHAANGRFSRWACYVGVTALAIYAQIFAVLIVVAQVVACAGLLILPNPWRTRVQDAQRSLAVSLALIGILVAPLGLDALIHGGGNKWVPAASIQSIINFFIYLCDERVSYLYLIASIALLALLIAARSWIRWVSRWLAHSLDRDQAGMLSLAVSRQLPPATFGLICWLVVPMLLSYVMTQPALNLHLFWDRYLIGVVPPFYLLVGTSVGAFRWRLVRLVLALLLIGFALVQLPPRYYAMQPDDFRSVAAWLETHYVSGDGVACYIGTLCAVPMDYYLHLDPGPAHLDADSPGNFLWDGHKVVSSSVPSLAAYSTRHRHIFVILVLDHRSPARQAEEQAVQQWLDGHCTHQAAFRAGSVLVRWCATGISLPHYHRS